jgi:hypothetical protein
VLNAAHVIERLWANVDELQNRLADAALMRPKPDAKDALPPGPDPIASAVRAELQPLEDALIEVGHKLAQQASPDTCDDLCMLPAPDVKDASDEERGCCRSNNDDGWCCTLRSGHAGEHIATNEYEFDANKLQGKVFARWP